MLPPRRVLNAVTNLARVGLLAANFITGCVAALLGLIEFGLHKYASIALLIVAAVHIGMHWRSLLAQLGPLLRLTLVAN